MKIIGTRNNGFIIDIDEKEIANLIGHYYYGCKECPRLRIGDEINISKMYDQLYALASHKNALKDCAHQLCNYAKLIELTDPIIKAHIAESEEKE